MDHSAYTSGMNGFPSSSYNNNNGSQDNFFARGSKRKTEPCPLEPKPKHRSLVPLPSPMSQNSQEAVPTDYTRQVQKPKDAHDIRQFYERYQVYHGKMKRLNEMLYGALGYHKDYLTIEKELRGFLGELQYYREKEEWMNNFYRYRSA